jgi:hypothetical protein
LSAVQQAMVDNHGSQCGFCTPGIVASLHALWLAEPNPSAADIERQLQGNLCRCTGYEPIVKGRQSRGSTIPGADNDRLVAAYDATTEALTEMADGARVTIEHERGTSFVPGSLDDLAALYEAHPQATDRGRRHRCRAVGDQAHARHRPGDPHRSPQGAEDHHHRDAGITSARACPTPRRAARW